MSNTPLLENGSNLISGDVPLENGQPLANELTYAAAGNNYKERKQTRVSANAAAYISLFLDFVIICLAIADISLLLKLPNYSVLEKYEQTTMKIQQIMLLLLFNHIFGTFPFFYVYLTVSIFPSSRQLQEATFAVNLLNSLESVFAFISMHLRYSSRFLAMPIQSSVIQMISGDIPHALRAKSYKSRMFSSLLIILCDIISALSQAAIFFFACNFEAGGEIELHYIAIYAGTPLFFLINFLVIHVIGKCFYKDIFGANKQRRRRYRKLVVIEFIAILLLGFVMGALINLIFWAYGACRKFIANLDPAIIEETNYYFPTFSNKQANVLATIICSFMLLYSSLFSIFVNQYHSQFLFVLKEDLHQMALLKTMCYAFVVKNLRNIISNSIVASVLLTSSIADFVSLLFIIASGGISGNGTARTVMIVVSFIGIIAIVVLYIYLVYRQIRKTSRVFAFLTFLTGFIAIPGVFSVSLVQNTLTKMMPCAIQSGFQMFLAQGIVPLSGAISFISSAPYMFPATCKQVRRERQKEVVEETEKRVFKELREVREFIQKQDGRPLEGGRPGQPDLLELQDPVEYPNQLETQSAPIVSRFTEPDLAQFYKASKLATGAFFYYQIRPENELTSDKKVLATLKKQGVFAQRQGSTVYVAVRGTRSILNITPLYIIYGLFDWAKAAFMPTVVYEYDDGYFCLVNAALLRYAERIFVALRDQLVRRAQDPSAEGPKDQEEQYKYQSDSPSRSGRPEREYSIPTEPAALQEVILTGHHQGAVVAVLVAQKLLRAYPALKATVYMFGTPMLVYKQLIQHVAARGSVHMCVAGADGKLFLSSILANELKWPDELCFCVDHAASGKYVIGYYAIMSTGSDPEMYIPALKRVV